jgi:hypothetical protein
MERELNQQEMIDSLAQAYRGALNAVMIAQNMPNHIEELVGGIKSHLSNSDQQLDAVVARVEKMVKKTETRILHSHMKWCYKCMHSLIADVASSLVANSHF